MSVYYIQGGKKILIAGNIPSDILDEMSTSKQAAQEAASAAETSAQNAKTNSDLSRSYAIGTGGEVRPDDGDDNAKKYYEQAKMISESFAGTLRPKGTIAFSELPPVSVAEPGDMYNISDDFTTTSDFMEGAGLEIPLGSNVYMTDSGKWDILAGGPVSSVNGMRGNVSVTPENIGALPTTGGTLTGVLNPSLGINYIGKGGTSSYIVYPEDGYLFIDTARTGYIKIELPRGYSSTMLRLVVSIFNYVSGETMDYYIAGYNYYAPEPGKWYQCTAFCVGSPEKERANLDVRFGYDGGKCIIAIGSENLEWSFPMVRVRNIMVGKYSAGVTSWKSGWKISIAQTPIEKIDATITNTNIAMLETDSSDYHAIHHRNTYRGKNIGNSFTAAQKAAIQNGTFEELYVGDYWVINGITWRIVDINYWLGTGDVECTKQHLVVMPDEQLYTAKMNDGSTTVGGYYGSKMYKENLQNAKNKVAAAFGATFVLNHRDLLSTVVTNGYPSGGAWHDSTVELPNEIMMYGSIIHTPAGQGSYIVYRYTINKTQLALMRLNPKFINPLRKSTWLRDVGNGNTFSAVNSSGSANVYDSGYALGVRPVFGLTGVAT